LLRECEIPFKLTKNNGQIQQIQAKITWEASLVDKSGVEHILPLTASKEEYEKFIQEQKDCKSFSFHPILKNIKDLVACKGAPLWESELDDLKYDLSAYGVAILSAVMASQGENKDLIDAHLQLNSNGSVSVLPPEVSSISGCKSILSYYNKTEEDLFSLIGSQEALSTPINLVAEGEVFNHHRQHKNKSLRQLALDMERWEAIHHVNMAALNLITKETSTENNKRQIIDNKRVLLCGKCGVVKKKVGRSVWKKIFADNGTKMRKPLEKWAGESFKSRNNVVKDGINFVGKSLTR